MRVPGRRAAIAALALLAMSCASSSELTRRSEVALGHHDYERAFAEARAALEKDPRNGHARLALAAAASPLIARREQRILNLAAIDTLGAADACLELEEFRSLTIRYGVMLPRDSSFAERALGIRQMAAGNLYRDALINLKQGAPKQAYRELTATRRYAPGYRDVETRIPQAWERAVTRVAVLPFDDETGTPGLSRSVADQMAAELSPRLQPRGFEFTRLVPASAVYGALRVAQLGDLSRDEAIDIGRTIGARQVVYGRLRALNTHSDTDRYHSTIWRKVAARDSAGRNIEIYVDAPFDAVQRRRQVELRVEFEVIDVASEAPLAQRTRDVDASARTVYTSFLPDGDCDAYCLVPPSMKANDHEHCERLEQEWKGTFQSWTVPKLLARAKRDHARTRYRSEYRGEFAGRDPDYPIFLDDMPSSDELVRIALDDSWRPVLDVLKELDPRD